MKHTRLLAIGAAAVVLFWMAGLALAQGQAPEAAPVGTAFTYQGKLNSSGMPYTGPCDMQFGLYDALSGGAQVGTLTLINVAV